MTYGNVMQTADLIGVDPGTIYDILAKEPEIKKILYQARAGKYIRRCDNSEHVMDKLHMMVDTRPGYAFQAAKYYLDTHGKDRGYGIQQVDAYGSPNDEIINDKVDNMKLSHENKLLKAENNAYKSKTGSEPSGSDTQI